MKMRLLSAITSWFIVFSCLAVAQEHKPLLLVLSKPAAKLQIVDPVAKKVIGEVPTGTSPHELTVSEDGKTAFVGNYGAQVPGDSLSIIDIAARKEVRRHNIGALRRPHGMVESHGKVYFTAEVNKVVARYDPASDSVDWIEGTGQDSTHMLVITADQKKIFTANIASDSISVLEPRGQGQNWHVTQITVGKGPEAIDLSPDEKEVWTSHSVDGGVSIIDVQSGKVKETIPSLTKHSNRLKFTPDGKLVLISDAAANEVLAIDASSRKLQKRIPVCAQPLGIQMAPGNKTAYVACGQASQIAIIDLSTLSQSGTIDVGPGPDGMAWAK
ncbi:MAG TPA: cytochrome D1 domain-containing protein [Candidatus Angelobacter sp.]|jgi:YVTN family beta-propeller protein|nr:cytochrome D1 domain-containing protein [Candidatus Angelobacter sp.]